MPELPEVETVRRGLAPVLEGRRITAVQLNRPDLRFPFAPDFAARIEGERIKRLSRRAKFLQADLSSGERLFMHLGMSGRFILEGDQLGEFTHAHDADPKHHHVVFTTEDGNTVTYNDPRRFGFMELVGAGEPYRLDGIGPEPLSNAWSAPELRAALKTKKTPIKLALLDQRVVAGLGNIYVCEALFRAGISPGRGAGRLTVAETESLVGHVKDVLAEAIAAGGSSLRDHRQADGALGYFQHRFAVYGREGEPCPACGAPIFRRVQGGRSTFHCRACQR
ncbi:MAG: bifunctional DNA-formamidopyrimidine glycosylase/DNA-(apurinic or apyrimidinic site) lyase [Pseudomonadota bacterium]